MSGTTSIPNDPNPALRGQLWTASMALNPQIVGLQALAATPGISAALLAHVTAQITAKQHRQALIQTVLASLDAVVDNLDALYNDGYPTVPTESIPQNLFGEVQADAANLAAAVAVFTTPAQVTGGQITFSPNPEPPTAPGP